MQDRANVLERAARAGVAAVIVTGCCVRTSQIAADHTDGPSSVPLYFTAGAHPHNAKARNLLDHLRPRKSIFFSFFVD